MTERQDIEMLLPWYVTGKLDDADRAKVDAYLAAHPDMLSQLEQISEDASAAIEVNELEGAPSAGLLNRLMNDVEQQFGPEKAAGGESWWKQQFGRLSQSFQVPVVRYAAIAAAVVIAAQTAAIGTLSVTREPAGYQTATNNSPAGYGLASGPDEAEDGPHLLVSFVPGATVSDITNLLEEIEGSIVSGPRGAGLYQVRITKEGLTEDDLDEIADALSKRTKLIGFVSVSD